MAAFPHDPTTQLADDGSSTLLLEVGRTIRDNFHVLCGLSLVFLTVALPWVVLGTTTSWLIAWAPLVLLTAPCWATSVAAADRMLAGDAVGWRMIGGDLRRLLVPSLKIGIPPALCGTVLLGIVYAAIDPTMMAMSLAMTSGVSLAVFVLLIPAMPLATRLGLTGFTLWQASAVVVVRRPMQVLGAVVLAGLGLWLALAVGPAMLLGVAPLGVLIAAITLPDLD